MRDFEDGASETIVVLEADESAAVVWTEPADLPLDLGKFATVVGNLREGEFFAIWGDGTLSSLSADCPPASLAAIFTFDGGELFSSQSVRRKPTAEPDVGRTRVELRETALPPPDRRRRPRLHPPARNPPCLHPAPNADQPVRLPVPDPLSLERSRDLVRELYHKEYESKQEISQQQAMAQRMLKQAEQMTNDPAGQYVLLDIAIKIATRIGDTSTAISALDDLTATFEVDELSTAHAALVALAKKDRSRVGISMLLAKSRTLIDKASSRSSSTLPRLCVRSRTAAARQLGDRRFCQPASTTGSTGRGIGEGPARRATRLATLTDKDDPDAHLRVGRYYCFTKGEWEKGLPLLAKCSDTRLQRLAEEELRESFHTRGSVETGRRLVGTGRQGFRDRNRSTNGRHIGTSALPALPSGLWRAKVEMRLKEFRQLHGENAVASSRTPSRSSPSSASD